MKKNTYISIAIIIIPTLMMTSLFWYGRQVDKIVSTPQIYAKEITREYKEPTLNPNLTEREQNIELIRKIWGRDYKIGLAMARCESGYRTKIINSIGATGIFQVLQSAHDIPYLTNPVANISYAYTLYLKQGTNPWISSKSCWDK